MVASQYFLQNIHDFQFAISQQPVGILVLKFSEFIYLITVNVLANFQPILNFMTRATGACAPVRNS